MSCQWKKCLLRINGGYRSAKIGHLKSKDLYPSPRERQTLAVRKLAHHGDARTHAIRKSYLLLWSLRSERTIEKILTLIPRGKGERLL